MSIQPAQRLRTGLAAVACCFSLAAAATIVQVDTPLGAFQIQLFDSTNPRTVENFLNYVNDGDYENSFIHRSVSDFIVQGGGYRFLADADPNHLVQEVEKDPPIENEFKYFNTRSTIGMARLPGQPDSATSEWFINVVDNHDLDITDGGFTVFGHVIGDGMQVVDAINNATILRGLRFESLPIVNVGTAQRFVGEDNLIFTDITVVNEDDEPFVINSGISGAWDNPAIDGQGLVFDVIDTPDRQVVTAAWFTYDLNEPPEDELDGFGSKQHRWFTLLGEFEGNSATMDIQLTAGGIFNDPTEVVRPDPVGTATVTFFDCFNGQFSFEFFGEDQPSGVFAIRRLTPATVCEMLNSPAAQE